MLESCTSRRFFFLLLSISLSLLLSRRWFFCMPGLGEGERVFARALNRYPSNTATTTTTATRKDWLRMLRWLWVLVVVCFFFHLTAFGPGPCTSDGIPCALCVSACANVRVCVCVRCVRLRKLSMACVRRAFGGRLFAMRRSSVEQW